MGIQALYKISYGVYIVGSRVGEKNNAQIANGVMQVTSEPPAIAICINKQNLTHEFIEKSGKFSVSVLSKSAPMIFIGQFGFKSGRDVDKFAGVKYKLGANGMPIVLDFSVASIEAMVVQKIDVGTHTIFIGNVTSGEVYSDDDVMTYEYYHEVKKGKSPKTAPTFRDEKSQIKKEAKMKRYVCKVCGYVYDPAVGDPDNGIPAGTPFEKLPDDWTCPVCGAKKSEFEQEE